MSPSSSPSPPGPAGVPKAVRSALTRGGIGRRLAIAITLGGLSALAMPPLGAFPVLFLTIPGAISLLDAARSRRGAFLTGWGFGFGFHLIGLYWISFALFTDIGRFWWALPFSAAGLPVALGLFAGAAGVAYRLLRGRGGWTRPPAFAAAWSVAEMLRSTAFTGFPWNLFGYAWTGPWIEALPVAQLASVIGIQGLSLLTVLAAAVPVVLFDPVAPRRRAVAMVAVTGLGLAAVAGWGAWRLSGGPDAEVPGTRLRLVQPAIPQALKWAPEARRANFIDHLELTALPSETPPNVVVWAETATPFFLEREPTARSMIAHALAPGAVLLTGSPRLFVPQESAEAVEAGAPPLYHNGLLAIDDAGSVIASYDKFHLVPFGEYMPLRRWLPVGAIAGNGGEYAPGPGPRTLTIPGAPPFSPLICYEAIFPDAVVDRDTRPEWLLNLTNDAWYGISAGPHQHLAIAAARAIEEGLPMVRVANTGISAVVDPHGRIVARLPLGARGTLDAGLPVRLIEPTTFFRWGHVPFWTITTLLAIICITAGDGFGFFRITHLAEPRSDSNNTT